MRNYFGSGQVYFSIFRSDKAIELLIKGNSYHLTNDSWSGSEHYRTDESATAIMSAYGVNDGFDWLMDLSLDEEEKIKTLLQKKIESNCHRED